MGELESYRILGVAPGVSFAELKQAYRRLVKAHHPDSRGGRGNSRTFSLIVEAYRSLAGEHAAREARRAAAGPRGPQPARGAADSVRPQGSPRGRSQGGRRGDAEDRQKPGPETRQKPGPETRQKPGPEARQKPGGLQRLPGAKPPGTLDIFPVGRTLLLARDPQDRAAAARVLAASGRKSSYAFLRKAFNDPDDRVVSAAVRAIAELDIRQSVGEIGSLFSKAGPALRRVILSAAARMGHPGGFEDLASIGIRDDDPWVRTLAAKLLGGRAPVGR